ncbi:MAG: hypothetical protein AAGD11_09345 [Planctomycetota bacterium]
MTTFMNRNCLFALLSLTLVCSQSVALPVKVVHVDTPDCDPLFIPSEGVHEIGDFTVFPSDEALFASDQGFSQFPPCPASNSTTLADPIVEIRNLSGRDWIEVWYVASPETTITNFDGEADDILFAPLNEAFRIDNDIRDPGGVHHSLIFESMTPDGIWEAGESWRFVLQDYMNALGLPPSAINSLGVGSASMTDATGLATSSGSIIGITLIPEPSTGLLSVVGLLAVASRRFGTGA